MPRWIASSATSQFRVASHSEISIFTLEHLIVNYNHVSIKLGYELVSGNMIRGTITRGPNRS